jgi:hypothetical protein
MKERRLLLQPSLNAGQHVWLGAMGAEQRSCRPKHVERGLGQLHSRINLKTCRRANEPKSSHPTCGEMTSAPGKQPGADGDIQVWALAPSDFYPGFKANQSPEIFASRPKKGPK